VNDRYDIQIYRQGEVLTVIIISDEDEPVEMDFICERKATPIRPSMTNSSGCSSGLQYRSVRNKMLIKWSCDGLRDCTIA
jgi:hypothetical protein